LEIINIYLALFNFSGSTKYHPLFVLVFFLLFLKVMSLPTKKKQKAVKFFNSVSLSVKIFQKKTLKGKDNRR